jgi:thioredoxin-dependent peroxiredoxin
MKTLALFLWLYLGLSATAAQAALKPGDTAPGFTVAAAQGGKEFKFALAEALQKGPVVLYFYPKSFTKVCTAEAHEFAENVETFAAPIDVQREFSTKECRDKFPVGADPGLTVINAYDAALPAGRWRTAFPTSSRPRGRSSPPIPIPTPRSTSRTPWPPSGNGARSTSVERRPFPFADWRNRFQGLGVRPGI